jgi:uncharacterized protein
VLEAGAHLVIARLVVQRGGVESLGERQRSGARLRLPQAEVGLVDLRRRCVMTTCDPDTAAQDPEVLRHIVRQFGGQLCLDARVTRAGHVEVGHRAVLVTS